ncbi:hypothetical protein [Nitratifractor sp.]
MKEREKSRDRERETGLPAAECRRIEERLKSPSGSEAFYNELSGLSAYEILQCRPQDRWEEIERSYRRLMEECDDILESKRYPNRLEVRRVMLRMIALEEAYQRLRKEREKNP